MHARPVRDDDRIVGAAWVGTHGPYVNTADDDGTSLRRTSPSLMGNHKKRRNGMPSLSSRHSNSGAKVISVHVTPLPGRQLCCGLPSTSPGSPSRPMTEVRVVARPCQTTPSADERPLRPVAPAAATWWG